jgi:hypothetical protein
VLHGRAQFSIAVDGVEPAIASDGRLELRAARHPLMIPAVQRHLTAGDDEAQPENESPAANRQAPAEGPVPVDIVLVPPGTACW